MPLTGEFEEARRKVQTLYDQFVAEVEARTEAVKKRAVEDLRELV